MLVIKAILPYSQKPQSQTYLAHARLHSGEWTSVMRLKGISQLTAFLRNNRVDTKQIDTLIEQLNLVGNIIVSNTRG
jgi:hypothetical protein